MTRAPKRLTSLAAILLTGTMLSACASDGLLGGDSAATETPEAVSPEQAREQAIADLKTRPIPDEPMSRAAYWAQRTELEPEDVDTAVQFAKALRGIGSNARAVEFLEERLAKQPGEVKLLAEYGKSLIAVGQIEKALGVLAQAQQMAPDDWTILVAMGVGYDQLKDYANARRAYEMALALSPNNPSILNNLGLSYLMAGDRENAAKYLMAAASSPGADARVRANLKLIADRPAETAKAEPALAPAAAPEAAPKAAEPPAPKPKPTASAEPEATGAPRTMVTAEGSAGLRGTD
ncbi:MAG: tetratricopeptide repeat protein [Micropepsaceae bacterium]